MRTVATRSVMIAPCTARSWATREALLFFEIIRDWMDGEMKLEEENVGWRWTRPFLRAWYVIPQPSTLDVALLAVHAADLCCYHSVGRNRQVRSVPPA